MKEEIVWRNANGPVRATIADSDIYVYLSLFNEPDWEYDKPFQYCGTCGSELIEWAEIKSYNRHDASKNIRHIIGCKSVKHERWEKVRRDSLPEDFLELF